MCTGNCEMESDREIESSETEMETDKEIFERDASAVPEDHLVKMQNAKAAVWRYFGLETESGMVKDPDLPVCRVCHVRVKTKHANTSNLYSHLKKAVRPKRNDKRKGKASLSTTRECTIEEFLSLPLSSGSREHKELTISSACLILETTCQYLVISWHYLCQYIVTVYFWYHPALLSNLPHERATQVDKLPAVSHISSDQGRPLKPTQPRWTNRLLCHMLHDITRWVAVRASLTN